MSIFPFPIAPPPSKRQFYLLITYNCIFQPAKGYRRQVMIQITEGEMPSAFLPSVIIFPIFLGRCFNSVPESKDPGIMYPSD